MGDASVKGPIDRRRGMEKDKCYMAEIINLKQVRKEKARRERSTEADANRRRFGRTRAEKQADKEAEERARRSHYDRRLEPDET